MKAPRHTCVHTQYSWSTRSESKGEMLVLQWLHFKISFIGSLYVWLSSPIFGYFPIRIHKQHIIKQPSFILINIAVTDTRKLAKVIVYEEIIHIYLEMVKQQKQCLKGVLIFVFRDKNIIAITSTLIVSPSSSSHLFFK